MILYTIMPPEVVLEGMNQPVKPPQEIDLGNVKLLVETMGLNQGKVVRLISTDPQDYLNPNFQPGSIIDFKAGC